uniref:Ig-like domain-containing protein n=1 Tax=Crocodylus porosus TaxID=8502 RepID=A0A7M4EWX0_CROPO
MLRFLSLCFIFKAGFPTKHCGDAQMLKQSKSFITKGVHKTARIQCVVSGISLRSAYIHWYRQKPRNAPEWILYLSSGEPVIDQGFEKEKFEVDKDLTNSTCTLTVKQINKKDAATYYCAYWDNTKLSLYAEPHPFKHLNSKLCMLLFGALAHQLEELQAAVQRLPAIRDCEQEIDFYCQVFLPWEVEGRPSSPSRTGEDSRTSYAVQPRGWIKVVKGSKAQSPRPAGALQRYEPLAAPAEPAKLLAPAGNTGHQTLG